MHARVLYAHAGGGPERSGARGRAGARIYIHYTRIHIQVREVELELAASCKHASVADEAREAVARELGEVRAAMEEQAAVRAGVEGTLAAARQVSR